MPRKRYKPEQIVMKMRQVDGVRNLRSIGTDLDELLAQRSAVNVLLPPIRLTSPLGHVGSFAGWLEFGCFRGQSGRSRLESGGTGIGTVVIEIEARAR